MSEHGHDGGTSAEGTDAGAVTAPPTIICVDCGGICHLLSWPNPDDDSPTGFAPGDIVAYRCEDCMDRWDIELE